MTHTHKIVDTGKHFVIDPVLRLITTETSELVVVQGDHNSERYTFEIPRMVEGHDMSLCNRIEIHYDNIAKNKKDVSEGFCLAENVSIDGDTVNFSWLISGNATRLAGTMQFWINFICTNDSNNIIYSWGTSVFKGVRVVANNNNTDSVIAMFPDVLEQWKDDIVDELEIAGNSPILLIESPDDYGNDIFLRDLESGVYILQGNFLAYDSATSALTFSSGMLVNITRTDDVSYVQILYSRNNTVQYLEISDDSVLTRDAKLIDMQSVSNMTTVIDDESDDEHYPSAKAVKELVDSVVVNGDCNVTRVESLDNDDPKTLRDLDSGAYVLYGYFKLFPNDPDTITINERLAVVESKIDSSYVIVYDPSDFKMMCYEIRVDETSESGFASTSTVVNLLDIPNENRISEMIDEALGVVENGAY